MAAEENNKNQKKTNSFSKMEEEVLDFWDKSKTFKKSIEKEAPQGDYVFYDGPPFITGLPHYATLLPSIAKDVIPRYWTMNGYRVERVWGWDCHGLPAENKVEEQLGLKNKKDIEKLGVDKFINACRNYVDIGSEQWEWYIKRIARWVDMKNAYRTMDLKFMESVIWAFKELYNKGLVYEGYRSSLHCPRCATPLSKFEITMDAGSYRDVTDQSLVIKFKLKTSSKLFNGGKKQEKTNVFLLAWTTTPWTLPGNLALAVNKKIDYAIFRLTNTNENRSESYILAQSRLKEILKDKKYKIIRSLKGKDLIGLEYEPVFDLKNKKINKDKNVFKVYHGDFVSLEEGTGIVHIAPNFGEDDFKLGEKNNLPLLSLMDENGVYTKEAGEWEGLYFKKANKAAQEKLKDKIFSSFEYTHSYPFCYRCGTPLIYKTQKAWYLRIGDIRKKMLEANKSINWVPPYFKEGRFQYNLENAPDWCLSRSRYWGSPIPVWKCKSCGEIKVAGSIKELEELAGKKIIDLHKPEIDKIKFKCKKCGLKMERVPEVLDCWFESGSMPFAQFHYPFERKKEWSRLYPADFIIEYTGQLRGWFYYLHVLGNSLFNKKAFKNVIVTGVLAGTDGRKMSKSFGNYPDPKETLNKYGGDALRIYFMGSPIMLGGDMNLNEKDIQDSLRKNVILLWNVAKFFKLFADENKFKLENNPQTPRSNNVLDKWILSRLNELIIEVTKGLDNYNMPQAVKPITGFISDLSTWYLRRSRSRFKSNNQADKNFALETTCFILNQFSKVIAPFMPFIAERIWQNVIGNNFQDKNKSVHLEEWPVAGKILKEILQEMEQTRKIVELGLAKRDEAAIKVRQPLSKLKVKGENLKSNYLKLIKDEVNVKEVEFIKSPGELEVELETKISAELELEGIKRELVRFINVMRKKLNFTINDAIKIYWESNDKDIKKAINKHREEIIKDTLAYEIIKGKFIGAEEFKINEGKAVLGIEKK